MIGSQTQKGKFLKNPARQERKPKRFGRIVLVSIIGILAVLLLVMLCLMQNRSVFQSIIQDGYAGTQEQWLASLVGEEVDTRDTEGAYELAIQRGYKGTKAEWIETLTGVPADDVNASPYSIACESGFEGSLSAWLTEIADKPENLGKSDDGIQRTEYELACEHGYSGTFIEWIVSVTHKPVSNADGKSVYEQVVASGYNGSVQEWLASLVSTDGISAYELAFENGFSGTLEEWQGLMIGQSDDQESKGDIGIIDNPDSDDEKEDDGATEAADEDAVSIVDVYINDKMHLIMVLGDGTEIDGGRVDSSGDRDHDATYTVTFMDYNGVILKTQTVKCSSNATPPANPVREGHTFAGWSGSYTNITADVTVVARYQPDSKDVLTHIVTFVGHDGSVLKTDVVENGAGAKAPSDPFREGYTFVGWDKAFDNVTSDLTVTATYEKSPYANSTIYVSDGTGVAGESIQIPIMVENNPGIAGATIEITFDAGLTLVDAVNGETLGEMDFSTSDEKSTPFKCSWDSLDGEIARDGTLVILTFNVPASAMKGDTFAIHVSYRNGDIYNNAWEDLEFDMVSGSVVVS